MLNAKQVYRGRVVHARRKVAAESNGRQNLKLLIDNEIPIALGTDAGAYYSFFGDIAGELPFEYAA